MIPAKIYKIVWWLAAVIVLGILAYYSVSLAVGALCLAVLSAFLYFRPLVALYALIAYLPFQVALNLSGSVDLLSGRVLILLLAAIWLAKAVREKKLFLPKDFVSWSLVLFFTIAAISVLVAQNQAWALRKLLVFASIFPLYFLALFLIGNIAQLVKAVWFLVGSAALSAVIALAQFGAQFTWGANRVFSFWARYPVPVFLGNSFGVSVLQNPSWFVEINGKPLMRAIGLFPDPHMLAFFLGMILPVVLVMFFYKKRYRKILFVIFCLMSVALALTFSRGGYAGALAGIFVTSVLLWKKLDVQSKAFAAAFVLLLVVFISLTPVISRFFSSFDLSEGSNSSRLIIWEQSLNVSKANPILGVGLGNYPLSLNFNENYRSAVTSHNVYLDVLAELGIFGFLAWLFFLFSAARNCWITLRTDSNIVFVFGCAFLGSLSYFVVHSFFETPIFNPTILAFLMLFVGFSGVLIKVKR